MLRSILFVTCLFTSTFLQAQKNVHTVHYSASEGMLSNVTYSGLFDRNNYLWICTDRGLSRFDGTTFTHFTINEGLPDNDIVGVTEDGNGTIWAQPFQRETAFLERGQPVFTNINTIIPPDTVDSDVSYRVFRLNHGAVALLAKSGAIRIIQDRKWIATCRMPIVVNMVKTFIYETPDNRIAVVVKGETYLFDRKGKYFRQPNNLSVFRSEFFGNLLVAQETQTDSSLIFINLPEGIIRRRDLPHSYLRFGVFRDGILTGDASRNIRFTSYKTGKTTTDSLHALVAFAVENRDGTVRAIFTADEGIFIRTFTLQHDYASLSETPAYFYLDQGKLKVANGHHRIIFPVPEQRIGDTDPLTIPFFAERVGDVQLSYGYDLTVYRGGKYAHNVYPVGGIKRLRILNDSIRYVSAYDGVYVFNKNTLSHWKAYNGRVTCASAGPGGSILIGTHWGLRERKRDGTIYNWTEAGRFPNIRIVDILYHDNVIWIATAGKGLIAIFNGKVTSVLTDRNGVSRNIITAIAQAEKSLYVGYYDGAQKITYSVKNGVISIGSIEILNTYRNEGIKSFFLHGKMLYAIGNRSVFTFDTRKTNPVQDFNLQITRVMINNALQASSRYYSLEHGNYDFVISLSTINFEQFPLRYRFRINDGRWNYTSDPEIRYTNLNAGFYRIVVQVLDNYCQPSDTRVIAFDINPPFFRRTAFLIAAGLVTLGLVSWLAQSRIRKKYRKEKEQLIHESKLNELELIALKAQINPHFVFNCLNSVKALIYEAKFEEADRYIDRFAALFRNTLEASSSAFHPLSVEISYLRTYLEMEQISHKGRFDFDISAPENIDSLEIPPMLLQPYVENAVKHGMRGLKDRKGQISIRFTQQQNELICTVSDNGPGIAHATQVQGIHAGKGMSITSRRAQLYKFETEIYNHAPSGTVVKITVPIASKLTPHDTSLDY